jgi:hypothetical protein
METDLTVLSAEELPGGVYNLQFVEVNRSYSVKLIKSE